MMPMCRLSPEDPLWIISFPTRGHWRNPSRLDWINAGLQSLHGYLRANAVRSVAMPAVGAGLGGLSWDCVRASVECELGDVDYRVMLYPPHD